MYKEAIGCFITKMVTYKSGSLVVSSAWIAAFIECLTVGKFLGVSKVFLLLITVLYLVDFLTGVAASRSEGEKVKSKKITYTIVKFMAVAFWIVLAHQIQCMIGDTGWLQWLASAVSTIPLVLITLREFISIGENIERKYGRKPYTFQLVEKLFEGVENLLMKRIEASDVTTK